MSIRPRDLARASRCCSRAAQIRHNTTASSSSNGSSSSSPSPPPPLRASLLLSRQPLLTKTPHPLASAYYSHSLSLRHSISNPTPEDFYFRPGSLPHRRFQLSNYQYELSTYGPVLAGQAPDVGDIPAERPVDEIARDKWEEEDSARGEKSLERRPEEEVFCLVQEQGKWAFPGVQIRKGENLHGAVERVTGAEGLMGGRGMDTWLVTRKPVGLVKDVENRNFFLRSHILAGEPKLTDTAPWKTWAWLTKEEVEARLREQGDEKVWDGVRGIFGVSSEAEVEGEEEA